MNPRPTANAAYDAIVVGARPAGAATAMLLAERGHKVLVVDRSAYGSDTLSTHALMRGAVVQLSRWGVLDDLIAAGTPAIERTTFHYTGGDAGQSRAETVPIGIKASPGAPALFAPRRTVLDAILVDAARRAGVEFRFGLAVTGLARDAQGRVVGVHARDSHGDRDGQEHELRARITIGADGVRSRVAREVGAGVTRSGNHAGSAVYGHFEGLGGSGFADGYHWYYGGDMGAGAIPTNDDSVCIFVSTTSKRFRSQVASDVEAGFHGLLGEVAPELEAFAARASVPRYRSFPGIVGFFRKPWGPGWALVGDAAYFKDPISAHGITDALRDAELLAGAVDEGFGGDLSMPAALAAYEQTRDHVSADVFDVTDKIASYTWSMGEIKQHLLDLSKAMSAEVELFQPAPTAA